MQNKIIIYQVLTRLWRNGKFSDWDADSFAWIKALGADFIWFTGIPRHSSGQNYVKGDPGSPYSIIDYYDVNPYLADNKDKRMDEFKSLINRTHAAGLKAVIDFVPNHISPDYCGDIPAHPYYDYDWSDTRKINYDDPSAYSKMTDIVRFWASLGVDGVRCDMAELVPLGLFKHLVSEVKRQHPDFVFIAEVYKKESYRQFIEAGIDLLYDKSGLYDSLCSIILHGGSARQITWNWQCLSDMQPHMLNFLENHDELRYIINKPAALAVAALFNNASFMLYFGQEIGEKAADTGGRTSIFNWSRKFDCRKPLKAEEASFRETYLKIMGYAARDVFRYGANHDLTYCNENSDGYNPDRHFAFLRYNDNEKWLVVCNFSGEKAKIKCRLPEGSGSYEVEVDAWGAGILDITS